jgi:hypothetical protein
LTLEEQTPLCPILFFAFPAFFFKEKGEKIFSYVFEIERSKQTANAFIEGGKPWAIH